MAAKKIQGAWSVRELAKLVKNNPEISRKRQCDLLGIKRTRTYYTPKPKKLDWALARAIWELYSIDPCLGARRLPAILEDEYGIKASRERIARIKRILKLGTQYEHRDTSAPAPGGAKHKFPYLLKDMTIDAPDIVWSSDITYLPMGKGHIYLCAVMDWASREVLGWNIGNCMDADFCVKALDMALATGRKPMVINTDQGSQYTSDAWINAVKEAGITISMDGRGRWRDNVRMERFWRTYKYERFFLMGSETTSEVVAAFIPWLHYYNTRRPHQALGNIAPAAWGRGRRRILEPPSCAPRALRARWATSGGSKMRFPSGKSLDKDTQIA